MMMDYLNTTVVVVVVVVFNKNKPSYNNNKKYMTILCTVPVSVHCELSTAIRPTQHKHGEDEWQI